jgi:uncharacterized protein (TIGR02246 family)
MTQDIALPSFAGPSAADQAAVWAVTQKVIAAWANNDADAFARIFAEDATLILPGLLRTGREEIRAYMANAFAGPYKGSRVTGKPINIKFLSPEAVLIITHGGVLKQGETQLSDVRAIRAMWLIVKRDGQWLLTAYQNCPAIPA